MRRSPHIWPTPVLPAHLCALTYVILLKGHIPCDLTHERNLKTAHPDPRAEWQLPGTEKSMGEGQRDLLKDYKSSARAEIKFKSAHLRQDE